MRPLFWGALLAILYFCLYPFQLDWSRSWHWPQHRLPTSLADIRDFSLNVILFLPLGFFGALSFRKQWLPVLIASTSLSAGIEFLQIWIPWRHSNLFDLVANSLGAVVGVLLAQALAPYLERIPLRISFSPAPLALGILFIISKLAPFFPQLSPSPFLEKLQRFVHAPWRVEEVLVGVAECALIAELFRTAPLVRWAIVLAAPAGALLIGGAAWRPGVLLGNLVGVVFLVWAEPLKQRWTAAAAWLSMTVVIAFQPFRLGDFHPINWVPFANAMELRLSVLGVMAGKVFLYFGLIYFLDRVGMGLLRATLAGTALIALGEWVQQYLPGRVPEVTDPILCLLCGGLLACDIIYVIRSRQLESPLPEPHKEGRME